MNTALICEGMGCKTNGMEAKIAATICAGNNPLDRSQTEAALRASEERYRVIFDQAAVGIAHTSPGGRFLMVNQRFCDLLGYTPAELQKMNVEDLTHPDDFNEERANLLRIFF